MCGLTGIAGPGINSWDLKILQDLITVSSLRGTDSTGLLQGKSQKWLRGDVIEFEIEKDSCDPNYFKWFHLYGSKGNRRLMNSAADNFMCVHTRAATKGDISKANAHPFEFDKIVGMHNGTMIDFRYDDKDKKKTDSELFLQEINDKGIIETLQDVNPNSAYALVIFNKEKGTLSFVRNEKRPLYFGIHENRSVLYWASEPWMIRGCCARNQEKLFEDKVWMFNPHRVYTCHPDDIRGGRNTVFDSELYEPKKWETRVHYSRGRFQQQEQLFGSSSLSPWTPQKEKEKGQEKKVINIRKVKYDKKTKLPIIHCCGPCQRALDPLDIHYATKVGTNIYICRDCDSIYNQDKPSNLNEVLVH